MVKIDDRSYSPYLAKATVFDGGSGFGLYDRGLPKFAQMLLNGGKLGDERILSRKSVEF